MLPASGANTTELSLCEPSREPQQLAERRQASSTDFPYSRYLKMNSGKLEKTHGHIRALDLFLSIALVLQQRVHWFHIQRSCELQGSGALQFPGGVPTSLRNSGQQWDYPNAWAPLQHMLIEGKKHQSVHN